MKRRVLEMPEIKQGNNKFYVGEEDNPTAEISYVPTGEKRFIADSTYVSDEWRGQGVGKQLVERLVQHAREEGKLIIPQCPFTEKVMKENEEMQDVME
nr:GNAT family N-acetyltransferase [Halalkalibacillus halophilus]